MNLDNARAAKILEAAAAAVSGPRSETHGSIRIQHEAAAELWGTYLGLRTRHGRGSPLDARDVCVMMMLLKLSRTICGDGKETDHWLDMAGYAAGAASCITGAEECL